MCKVSTTTLHYCLPLGRYLFGVSYLEKITNFYETVPSRKATEEFFPPNGSNHNSEMRLIGHAAGTEED